MAASALRLRSLGRLGRYILFVDVHADVKAFEAALQRLAGDNRLFEAPRPGTKFVDSIQVAKGAVPAAMRLHLDVSPQGDLKLRFQDGQEVTYASRLMGLSEVSLDEPERARREVSSDLFVTLEPPPGAEAGRYAIGLRDVHSGEYVKFGRMVLADSRVDLLRAWKNGRLSYKDLLRGLTSVWW